MNKEELKQYIDDNIYENQDGEITGEALNDVLKAIVDDGGTEVEANPTGEATETLSTLKIGETIYTAPQGPQGPAGPQGPQGVPGTPGASGLPGANAFVHIKYAAESPTSDNDMHDTPQAGDKWMGVYSGSSVTAPTTYTSYEWSKYVGEGGGADIFEGDVQATDAERLQALANVSNQTANSITGKMGYKVLDPTKTFAEQVTAENTIYEIRDVYDLNNATITIPEGCILRFVGGMLKNGNINMQSSTVEAANVKIFDNVTPYSTSASGCRLEWNLRWFGMSPKASAAENTAAISSAFNIALQQGGGLSVYLPEGTYVMNGFSFRPSISCAITFRGDGRNKSVLKLSSTDTTSLFLFEVGINTSYISDIGFEGNTKNWNGKNYVFTTNPNPKLISLFTIRGYANTITRCGFNGSAGHGVWVDGNNALSFEDCVFSYNLCFGAFVLYNRGVYFSRPYAEFNGMGSIIHTQPYYSSNFGGSNRMIVKGGIVENVGKDGGGTYGVRGTALNYKDEQFEYTNSFVRLESVSADEIEDDREYNTNIEPDSINIVIKPLKYKKTTLLADTTIEFKDNQWNDFIVYKRNGSFDVTLEKDFLADDEIYLFDYQQNIKGDYEWEEVIENYQSEWNSLIKSTYQNSKIIVDQEHCGKNYDIIGVARRIEGIQYSQPALVDFQETNWCDFIYSYPSGTSYENPIFVGKGISTGSIYNPALTGMSSLSDHTNCYLYVFGQAYQAIRFTYRVKLSGESVFEEFIPLYKFQPNGNFCIEVKVGDMSNIASLQVNLISYGNKHLGYGAVISTQRFPRLNGGLPYQGKFANKPAFDSNKIGIGYPYFCTDKQTTEGATNGIMIYHKGNDVWVDALGRTIS